MITHKALKIKLQYDPYTGIFTRNGIVTGCKTKYRNRVYVRIRIGRTVYYAHRLAWFYMFRKWPNIIDHINGGGEDNRIDNLRDATHSENHANTIKMKNNTTGFKGVTLTKYGTFQAKIKKLNREIYLGCFKTPEEAHNAYIKKAKEIFGAFANAGFIILLLTSSALSVPCFTHREARDKWPRHHLYWHTSNKCWDNNPRRRGYYAPRALAEEPPPECCWPELQYDANGNITIK